MTMTAPAISATAAAAAAADQIRPDAMLLRECRRSGPLAASVAARSHNPAGGSARRSLLSSRSQRSVIACLLGAEQVAEPASATEQVHLDGRHGRSHLPRDIAHRQVGL